MENFTVERAPVRILAPEARNAPHLATFLDCVWHIRVLPRFPLWALWEVATMQASAHALKTLLVLDSLNVVSFEAEGRIDVMGWQPAGGPIVVDRMALPHPLREDPEFVDRRARLMEEAVDVFPFEPSPWMGGWAATPEEIEDLAGWKGDVPRGLERCPRCGELTGACVIPTRRERMAHVPVLCRCCRSGGCARCDEPFHEQRAGSAWFDEAAGEVRYAPALLALRHTCADLLPEQ